MTHSQDTRISTLEDARALGLTDAVQTPLGIVLATVPATVSHDVPVVAFNAHVDTSPETTGAGVRPQVVRNYPGGDLPLPAAPDKVIRVAENPELAGLVGRTLITTDGTRGPVFPAPMLEAAWATNCSRPMLSTNRPKVTPSACAPNSNPWT